MPDGRFRFHPLLVALHFPLWLYARNFYQTDFLHFFTSAAISVAAAGIACLLLAARTRDRVMAAVAASAGVAVFYLYGHAHLMMQRLTVDPWIMYFGPVHRPHFVHYAVIGTHVLLIAAGIAAWKKFFGWIRGGADRVVALDRGLGLASVYLVLSGLLLIGWQAYAQKPSDATQTADAEIRTVPATARPDVYYVILDGFARPDVLRDWYKCDISATLSDLKKMGFYIPEKSQSNYSQTLLSLASSLNMTLLDDVQPAGGVPEDWFNVMGSNDKKYLDLIRNNRLMRFFKQQGYQIVNLASIWSVTMNMPQADRQFRYRKGLFQSEFEKALFGMSFLKVFNIFFSQDIAEWHLYNLEVLRGMPSAASPKFVFLHLVLPHSPYVFDQNGRVTRHISRTNMWDKQNNRHEDAPAYREQVVFTIHAMARAMKEIVADARGPKPIVILQADHGMNLIVNEPARLAEAIRHANFCAVYLPDGDYSRLYPEVTPVNLIRIILNQHFGQNLELLPDKTVYTGT